MGEAVGADPLPENVDGSIVETHSWNHEVQHSVQWDYVLIVLAALLIGWYLFVESDGADVVDQEEGEEGGPWN